MPRPMPLPMPQKDFSIVEAYHHYANASPVIFSAKGLRNQASNVTQTAFFYDYFTQDGQDYPISTEAVFIDPGAFTNLLTKAQVNLLPLIVGDLNGVIEDTYTIDGTPVADTNTGAHLPTTVANVPGGGVVAAFVPFTFSQGKTGANFQYAIEQWNGTAFVSKITTAVAGMNTHRFQGKLSVVCSLTPEWFFDGFKLRLTVKNLTTNVVEVLDTWTASIQ